jgi:hypothetical protein
VVGVQMPFWRVHIVRPVECMTAGVPQCNVPSTTSHANFARLLIAALCGAPAAPVAKASAHNCYVKLLIALIERS